MNKHDSDRSLLFYTNYFVGHNSVIKMSVVCITNANLKVPLWYVGCLLIVVSSKVLKSYSLNLGFEGTMQIQRGMCLFV